MTAKCVTTLQNKSYLRRGSAAQQSKKVKGCPIVRGRALEKSPVLASESDSAERFENEGEHPNRGSRPKNLAHCSPTWQREVLHQEGNKMAAACTLNWFSPSAPITTVTISAFCGAGRGVWREKEGKVTTDQETKKSFVGKDKWKDVPLALKTVIFFYIFFLLCFGFIFIFFFI